MVACALLMRAVIFLNDVSPKENPMNKLMTRCAAILPLILCLPGLADARPTNRCTEDILRGDYVFTASGFTRPPESKAGVPWVPKAILEVLHFNGDGTLSTPLVTVANPFGDSGVITPPGPGASGTYTINSDCSGQVTFSDMLGVAFTIVVDPPRGDTIWMIQKNPANNVFQGKAQRVQ